MSASDEAFNIIPRRMVIDKYGEPLLCYGCYASVYVVLPSFDGESMRTGLPKRLFPAVPRLERCLKCARNPNRLKEIKDPPDLYCSEDIYRNPTGKAKTDYED